MRNKYTSDELTSYFNDAREMFNDYMDTDYSQEQIIIGFFNSNNALKVYTEFCSKYFPDKYETTHEEKDHFDGVYAEAFVGNNIYGVLIREDTDLPIGDLIHVFLHELSHIYCVLNECEDGCFYDKYCKNATDGGDVNAGYAVWREFVADILAGCVESEYTSLNLKKASPIVKELYELIDFENTESKKCASLLGFYVMTSGEVASTTDWNIALSHIKAKLEIKDNLLLQFLETLFCQMHKKYFWNITPEFVTELGIQYLEMLSFKRFRTVISQP